jgi:hypothetical protein
MRIDIFDFKEMGLPFLSFVFSSWTPFFSSWSYKIHHHGYDDSEMNKKIYIGNGCRTVEQMVSHCG